MREIKTKVHVEGIKALDKAAGLTARAKNAYVKTREAAEGTKQPRHASPTEYAADSYQNAAQAAAKGTASTASKAPRRIHDNVARSIDNFNKAKNSLPAQRRQRAADAKESAANARGHASSLKKIAENAKSASNDANRTVRDAKQNLKRVRSKGRQAISEMKRANAPRPDGAARAKKTAASQKGLKATPKGLRATSKGLKATAKGQIKTAKKSVKTAERTARQTIKTAKQAAKAAQKSARVAIKTARVAVKAARVAAKIAVKAIKLAAKGAVFLAKAIAAAIKALAAAIAAGGWVAVLAIVIICLVAIIIASVFGIFLSGEASPETGLTINMAIAEIDDGFTAEIDGIINSNPHDLLDMSGSRALWKHVLAVYAVRTVTDPYNPMEVATMNDEKAQLLRAVFWDINTVAYSLVSYDVEIDILDDDGVPTGDTYIEAMIVLYITIHGKTIDEISAMYGFSAEQIRWLEELLDPEYHTLWNALLYGIASVGDGTLIEIAESQIGNVGGEIYWRWYGFASRVPWCAIFVSWVADQAGYIEAGIIPMFASTSAGVQWFRNRGQWQGRGYTPAPGDLIFFDWQQDGQVDHVGIVERVESGVIHTIEGNSSDSVRRRSYPLDSDRIFGFGVPVYAC